MPLNVAFLWHMHQPYYVDTVRNVALMPWVRLHATKGYLDMIWMVDQVPEFRCTFNLTPVLLKQIEQLARGEVRDAWHELATTPAESLAIGQKCEILEHFFKANWDNMIKPHPRYWSLLQKRGLNLGQVNLDRIAANFTDQEYRDLQVWFNLTWFGYAAEKLYPEVAELKRKGRKFTEDDKLAVFAQQQDVLKNLCSYYKAVAERGQIEISTTPFYHPIMPLVYNTEFARRCMPGAQLPPTFAHPEDVRDHLKMARDYHARLFGAPPHGVWPSEGSVCPELIPILDELGFEWFATDEEVLWRSLASLYPGRHNDRSELFRGYRAEFGDANVAVAFRERTLSDFIGFTAARNDPERAADFMIGHLEQIARNASGPESLCAVILDGENAWEHFPDGGEAFLRQLYQRLAARGDMRTTTFHQHFREHPPSAPLPTLHTGSWINANFSIWIGHPEDNRGWELLGQARDLLQSRFSRKEATKEQYRQAMDEIRAAEGSDWFWWYGDDFVTDNDLIFDELFRTHLQNVYTILGVPIPDSLKTHICRSEVSQETRKPTDLITPTIDGQLTSYYEWAGAGVYEAGRSMSAMYRTERLIESIHFGSNLETFFLRVDFNHQTDLPEGATLRVNFVQPRPYSVVISKLRRGHPRAELWEADVHHANRKLTNIDDVMLQRVLEAGIPFALLGWQPRDVVSFFVQLTEKDVQLERHPELGNLNLTVPDEQFDVENWRV